MPCLKQLLRLLSAMSSLFLAGFRLADLGLRAEPSRSVILLMNLLMFIACVNHIACCLEWMCVYILDRLSFLVFFCVTRRHQTWPLVSARPHWQNHIMMSMLVQVLLSHLVVLKSLVNEHLMVRLQINIGGCCSCRLLVCRPRLVVL